MDPNIQGDCNTCGRGFVAGVVCCCSWQTEEGEETGPDGIRVPYVRHLDAFCRDCCTEHGWRPAASDRGA